MTCFHNLWVSTPPLPPGNDPDICKIAWEKLTIVLKVQQNSISFFESHCDILSCCDHSFCILIAPCTGILLRFHIGKQKKWFIVPFNPKVLNARMGREKSHQFDIGLLNESTLVSFKPQVSNELATRELVASCLCRRAYRDHLWKDQIQEMQKSGQGQSL